jgi:hypothetical protein
MAAAGRNVAATAENVATIIVFFSPLFSSSPSSPLSSPSLSSLLLPSLLPSLSSPPFLL